MPGVSQADIEKILKANVRAVVTQDGWKLCWSDFDKSQLYDLKNDPYETTNLYYKNGHEYLIEKLKKKILDWQEKTKDSLKIES
jgi:arylsulfatase A-like enzyme